MLKRKIIPFALRLLLAVMLATFLAPNFAWQTVASHGEVAHADGVAVADDVDHHHDDDAHHQDHDEAAHSQIGHLLSHLPVVMPEHTPILPPAATQTAYPPPHHTFALADIEPPFKPPRSFLRS
jgi:hypothetical protein